MIAAHEPLPPGLTEALLDPSLDAIWHKLLAPLPEEVDAGQARNPVTDPVESDDRRWTGVDDERSPPIGDSDAA